MSQYHSNAWDNKAYSFIAKYFIINSSNVYSFFFSYMYMIWLLKYDMQNLLNDDLWSYQSISVIISIAAALLVTAGDSF